VSSEPPAIIMSTSPYLILLYESPIADAPVAHAVLAVLLGPYNLYLIVTRAVGILLRTFNIVNGDILLNPFVVAYEIISVTLVILEFITPILTPICSDSLIGRFESWIAWATY